MDKVYLVVSGYHEDYSVKAVFTEENEAKTYAERLNFIPRSPGDRYYVEDYVYKVNPELPEIPTYTYAYAHLFEFGDRVDVTRINLKESDVEFREYDVDIESNTDYGVLYEANRGSHYITLEAKIDIYPDDTWETINKRGYETLNNNFMKWKENYKNG